MTDNEHASKGARCRGCGWNETARGVVRCHCNPGETIRAWHGGTYGEQAEWERLERSTLHSVPNLGGHE